MVVFTEMSMCASLQYNEDWAQSRFNFAGPGAQSAGERDRSSWVTSEGSIWFLGVSDSPAFPTTADGFGLTYSGDSADGVFLRLDPIFQQWREQR